MSEIPTEIIYSDGAFIKEDEIDGRRLFDSLGYKICNCNGLPETIAQCREYFRRKNLSVWDEYGRIKQECSITQIK